MPFEDFEVEEDIALRDLASRRRRESIARVPDAIFDADRDVTEIRHLRDYGYTDSQIRERLGLTETVYANRLEMAGLPRYLTAEDRLLRKALDKLIATGQAFTSEALPSGTAPSAISSALSDAKANGRLRSVPKPSGSNYQGQYWQSTEKSS